MTVDQELFGDLLPTYLTRFVGRSREISEIETLLRDDRLVTICGAGGSGKTRLAIEVAKRWRSAAPTRDAHWVPLAAIGDPAAVQRALANALGVPAPGSDPMLALINTLRTRRALVLLDNCEHVAGACRDLLEHLMSRCPALTVLTTSREPLGLTDERVFPIPPLGSAGDLFVDRAATVSPVYTLTDSNAATIGQICERLDGLPLAIELAASWIRVLSASDLLAELDKSLDVLTSDGAPVERRHRSMSAVLDSSWQWLGDDERRILAALGVFVGGFSREAAESVAGASLASLAALVERALIQRLPDVTGGTRYQVHELVRSYALQRLERDGENSAESVRSRHFDFFLTLVERADAVWETPDGPAWLSRVQLDQANVDAAMRWVLEGGHTDRALRMAAGLFSFWIFTSIPAYYSTILHRTLSLPAQSEAPSAVRARAEALNVAGFAAIATGDLHSARSRFADDLALCERLEDPVLVARALRGLAHALLLSGELDAARKHIERSLTVSRSANDLRGVAWSAHDLGEWELASGHLERAEDQLTEALRQLSESGIAVGAYRCEVLLGTVHVTREDWVAALACFSRAIETATILHFTVRVPIVFEGLAEVAAALRRPEVAAQLFGAAATWRDRHGFPRQHYFNAAYKRGVTQTRRQVTDSDWAANHAVGSDWNSTQALQAADAAIRDLSLVLERRAVGLTEREVAVLRLVALGLSNHDIADRLVVSPRTVHAHLRSIFDKLGVSTRTAAAHEATRLNLV
jgi:predicted ATPase/DNA-binding CsgD family transcriptional regulator